MLKSTYVVGNVVKTNIDRYLINGEEFSLSQLGVDLFTVGLEIFAFKNAAKGLANAQSQSWCFVAGTLVATEEGYKAIEEIEAGDTVLAENPETGEVAYKTVLETYENETNELVHVHVNGEVISATPSHPFYVNQFGWTRATDLRAGDVLVLSNGEYVVVEFVQHEILEKPVKVFNFEVEDYHTYFVGEVSVLVHNGCGTGTFEDPITDNSRYASHSPKRLKANVWYKTGDFDYLYRTNSNGWIEEVVADNLQLKNGTRHSHYKNPSGKLPGDEAGHLLADIFGGSREADNIVAMLYGVNRSEYKKLENAWKNALENGQDVSVHMRINYGSSLTGRPESFDVDTFINGIFKQYHFDN